MADERVQRRLAAILAADVVGYSRLMEADEQLTRARLRSLHHELIDPRIAADGGRTVKTMGDGILVEFPSVVDAVHCALSIQKQMELRNLGTPEESRIELRIGVNTGDVIIEGEDIHGDGVNVAARLEGLCEPGGVYVSGPVYDQAEGKLVALFEDLGEHTVKNIARPVRVYRAVEVSGTHTQPQQQRTESSSPVREKPSIAVLPFENMSGDTEQEYFSDGMAEDLITDISKISGVSVTARNSSFAFKGQAVDVKEIAKKLGVGHVVEGSVRKMGDRLRVNAQLIDGANGRHIWAERYDGNVAEIFEFQDDIRKQIVSALQVSLTPTDNALSGRKPTSSVEAYDLFLRGRAHVHRFTPEHMLEGIECLEKAIQIDPQFADAYGYLSYGHILGWVFMWPGFDDSLSRGNELAEKAVTLDSASAMAVLRLGWARTYSRRYEEATTNLEKALALPHDNAEFFAMFGITSNWLGDPERGLEMLKSAIDLDTFYPPTWDANMGHSHLLLHQYDEAVARLLKAIERAPKFSYAYVFLACAYVELDHLDDAHKAVKKAIEISQRLTVQEFARIFPYRSDVVRSRILDDLHKAGMPEG